MSERLNSVDIEDVLSSIRRLVSDDQRPAAKAASAPAPAPDPQADKLILTPALRIAPEVEETVGEQAVPAPAPAAPAEPVMSFHSVRPERGAARLDAVMGQVARGLESGSEDWEAASEPPKAFASEWTEPEAVVSAPIIEAANAPEPSAQAPDLHEPMESAWHIDAGEAPFVDVDTDLADAAMPGQGMVHPEDITVSLDMLSGDVGQDQADGEFSDVPSDVISDVTSDLPSDLLSDLSSDVTSDTASDDLTDAGYAPDFPASGEPDMTALDAADADGWSETASMTIDTPPVAMAEEPAMTEKDDPADLPDWARMETEPVDAEVMDAPAAVPHRTAGDPRWADAAEAEIRRELEDEATASAFARFADDDLDDRPFDEDMLRDLVRDIIREELQGALGERITRNVRKLVRAEIARALAVRDFE